MHPAYSNLDSWDKPETSDIVYSDISGVLTGLLIDRGYLSHDVWEGAKPKYFIEVKATFSSYDTPFHMSKAQYEIVSHENSVKACTVIFLLTPVDEEERYNRGESRRNIHHFPCVSSWFGKHRIGNLPRSRDVKIRRASVVHN